MLVALIVATSPTALAQCPDNEIWYTTRDGKKAELYVGHSLDWSNPDLKIMSHTYANGKGVKELIKIAVEKSEKQCGEQHGNGGAVFREPVDNELSEHKLLDDGADDAHKDQAEYEIRVREKCRDRVFDLTAQKGFHVRHKDLRYIVADIHYKNSRKEIAKQSLCAKTLFFGRAAGELSYYQNHNGQSDSVLDRRAENKNEIIGRKKLGRERS